MSREVLRSGTAEVNAENAKSAEKRRENDASCLKIVGRVTSGRCEEEYVSYSELRWVS